MIKHCQIVFFLQQSCKPCSNAFFFGLLVKIVFITLHAVISKWKYVGEKHAVIVNIFIFGKKQTFL